MAMQFKYISTFFLTITIAVLGFGCKSDVPGPTVPYTFVYEELNLNSLVYQDLKQPKGFIYLPESLGYRGIVVIRDDDNVTYRAFDRACPYHPDEECAQVSVHSSGFFLEDKCCGSIFDSQTGLPTSGPAKSPLRPYNTFVNSSNYLIISSD